MSSLDKAENKIEESVGFGQFLGGIVEDIACFLFPPFCVTCEMTLPDGRKVICGKCRRDIFGSIQVSLPYCPYCHTSFPDYFQRCRDCGGMKSPGKLYALSEMDNNLLKYLHSFKYHGRVEIGEEFARKAHEVFRDASFINEADIIIPVPLHFRKRLDRGYNQAGIFSEHLSLLFDRPLDRISLKRITNTRSQTRLNPKQRFANVKGAFRVKERSAIKGKKILLVDDIVTTGATLFECARTLRRAGAAEVISFTIARPGAS